MPEERLLTIKDVVRRTALSRSTIFALLASGDLPSFTIGRSRRIRESALDAWIEERALRETQQSEVEGAAPGSNSEAAEEAGRGATNRPV